MVAVTFATNNSPILLNAIAQGLSKLMLDNVIGDEPLESYFNTLFEYLLATYKLS